jgi:hypothetical protein
MFEKNDAAIEHIEFWTGACMLIKSKNAYFSKK